MKKLLSFIFAFFLALTSFQVHAAAYDFIINQIYSDGLSNIPWLTPHPSTGSAILVYDEVSMFPKLFPTDSTIYFYNGSIGLSPSKNAEISGKMNAPSGTAAQYVRGDGSLATFPTIQPVPSNLSAFTNDTGFVTQSGARSALSLTTNGTSGVATYNASTGVLNVPNYAASGAPVINDSPARSLVTTTTSTGFQVSSARPSRVCYEGSFATTSTIGGPATASVFLETADTNSTTATDWTIKAQQTYSNTITLAVVLNQVQSNNWTMCRDIPAGKFVRIRAGNISGTASVTLNTQQQETIN